MILKHYVWLISLSSLAVWSSTQILFWSESIQSLIPFLPYVAIALGVFISLGLNRIQPILMLISLGFLNGVLFYFSPFLQTDSALSSLLPIFTFLLPMNMLLWILLPEKGIHNKYYRLLLALIFIVQAVVVYWLATDLPLKGAFLFGASITKENQLLHLPFLAGLMFLWAVFFLILKICSQPLRVFYHAVLICLLLMAYALNQTFDPNVLAWMSTFSAIIIVFSIIFDAHHMAYTDELTGMYGRRALMEYFLGLGRKYVVAMVDIDHFKKFNDSYGHALGDEVLCKVAKILDKVNGGKAYRYGGEEFTIVFARKTIGQVLPELERLRKSVESEVIEFRHQNSLIRTKVTVSIGVAQSSDEFKTAKSLLKFADDGLYQAKQAGRNRIIISQKKPAPPMKVSYYKGINSDTQ